jgi:FkbH-like protein
MSDFYQLKKNLKKDFTNLLALKIAVLGDTSTQFLTQALKGMGYDYGFNLNIFEADFNQIERQVFDLGSELYNFNPDFIILFKSSHKLLNKYNKLNPEQYSSLANTEIELIDSIYSHLNTNTNSKIIFYNYSEINDSIFGNYANKTEDSFPFQLRKLNYELMLLGSKHSNFYICDISTIQNNFGRKSFFQSSIYINSEMVLSLDILPEIAARTLDIINTLMGKVKKCLIVDLDNTLWGGVIGDDGLENIQLGNLGIGKAFTEFQYWIKKLKNRGIIIAVCSKNTESIAKEPFEKHPDMVLHLDDIAVFIANWENKVTNIKLIQSILNIGFDSMVFLDDNPFERNMVKENIPEITVPELPEDPAEYLEYLYSLNLFETVSYAKADSERTKQYQIEAQRNIIKNQFSNEDDFLKSLNMVSQVEAFNKFNIPRVAQLSQRSNQFNLRTIRYTEADIEKISQSPNYFPFTFTLEDKFGDNGLICVVILKIENQDTLFIDTFFMSCRVLKRSMEEFVLNYIVDFSKNKGYTYLKGEYIPTAKNEMVKNFYKNLGFNQIENTNYWTLNLINYQNKKCFIKIKK